MKQNALIQSARSIPTKTPPIWMMRQAGRYLPEYHDTKAKANGFLGLCKTPEYGIEVTLQPIRRFDFDAAIMFSDILIPAEAMGIDLQYNPGPLIANPIRDLSSVRALTIPEPETSLSFVGEILRGLRSELPPEKTLIGFAGAPFTVASYMVEGGSPKWGFETIRQMVYECPEVVDALLDKLVNTTVSYLKYQVSEGADIVQLFDSSAGQLTPDFYQKLALETAGRVIQEVKSTGVPVIYFAPGAMLSLAEMNRTGADVIGVDFRIGLGKAREILGERTAVQGNLDPAALLGSPQAVRRHVEKVLEENDGRPGFIFNLGHGVLPETPIPNVEIMVKTVRKYRVQ